MSTEGAKARDIQRIAKNGPGVALSSEELSSGDTSRIEIGFPAEKFTMYTTGTLTAQVTPKIGDQDANPAVSATGTVSTTTTANMFAAVEITATGGTGKLVILAR